MDLDKGEIKYGGIPFKEGDADLPPLPEKPRIKLEEKLVEASNLARRRGIFQKSVAVMAKVTDEKMKQFDQFGGGQLVSLSTLRGDGEGRKRTKSEVSKNSVVLENESVEDHVKSIFLRFFVAILIDFQKYLCIQDGAPFFDQKGFLESFSKQDQVFMDQFTQTQMFAFFTDSQLNPKDDDFSRFYFMECIQAKKNRSVLTVSKHGTPFLDDASHDISHTYFVPRLQPFKDQQFSYNGRFPRLRPDLFSRPRVEVDLIKQFEQPLKEYGTVLSKALIAMQKQTKGHTHVSFPP